MLRGNVFDGFLAFASAFVVFGISEPSPFVGVGDDEFVTVEDEGNVFIVKRGAIEGNGTVFFAHAYSELVHDAAVHAYELVFRFL